MGGTPLPRASRARAAADHPASTTCSGPSRHSLTCRVPVRLGPGRSDHDRLPRAARSARSPSELDRARRGDHARTALLAPGRGAAGSPARGDRGRPDLLARITHAAEGNPLFVEQMLAMLTKAARLPDLAIPPTIHALLAARLDRLHRMSGRDRASLGYRQGVLANRHRGAFSDTERATVGASLMTLARKELIEPAQSTSSPRTRSSSAHPRSRRRVPRHSQGNARRGPRALRGLAGRDRRRPREGARRDHRLPPRAGARLPGGARGRSPRALRRSPHGQATGSPQRGASSRRGDISAVASLISRAVELLPSDHPERRSSSPSSRPR